MEIISVVSERDYKGRFSDSNLDIFAVDQKCGSGVTLKPAKKRKPKGKSKKEVEQMCGGTVVLKQS